MPILLQVKTARGQAREHAVIWTRLYVIESAPRDIINFKMASKHSEVRRASCFLFDNLGRYDIPFDYRIILDRDCSELNLKALVISVTLLLSQYFGTKQNCVKCVLFST